MKQENIILVIQKTNTVLTNPVIPFILVWWCSECGSVLITLFTRMSLVM